MATALMEALRCPVCAGELREEGESEVVCDTNTGIGRGAFDVSRVGAYPRVQGYAKHLCSAADSFDSTYCVDTLHHALDLRQMVSEMARVTRRGGMVVELNEGTRALG